MKLHLILIGFSFLFSSCTTGVEGQEQTVLISEPQQVPQVIIDVDGLTLQERFPTPEGFVRTDCQRESYAYFLRNIALKPAGTKVRYHDGAHKSPTGVYLAVIDFDLGKRDLQQCADAVMRLRAEYLYSRKKYQDIHFNFTNGMQVDYKEWAAGQRMVVKGNKTYWTPKTPENHSYKSFQSYLDLIYTYAGSSSLSKELKAVKVEDLQIGDVFIVGGFPGHAITVMDLAENEAGEKLFILSQSYMPAQDIQILLNPLSRKVTPWYSLNELKQTHVLSTPEWQFTDEELMRF